MAHRQLNSGDPGFQAAFDALLTEGRGAGGDVTADVAAIIADVRARGDAALCDLTNRFDGFTLTPEQLRVSEAEAQEAAAALDPRARGALEEAAARIQEFHERQTPDGLDYTDAHGNRLGQYWSPIDAVGLYVPGGRATYPSSVLMNAVPARVAGVKRLAMVVPTPGGYLNPALMAAAMIAGVDEIWRVGGAQAVAALAYGSESIAPVDKIVGPGNAWVAEAKRQVFGQVGIDTIAGPSEILVIADGDTDPHWIAADLLSQAEHDTVAQSILITDSAELASAVEAAIEAALPQLATEAVARESWQRYGAVITVRDLDEAAALANRLAPEHLELAVAKPDALMRMISHAGAIFLGKHTPEAIGDYVAGTNHVLPTDRAARFSGGLSVYDFVKRTSFVGCTPQGLAKIGPAAIALADHEGLPAHARSVAIRLKQD